LILPRHLVDMGQVESYMRTMDAMTMTSPPIPAQQSSAGAEPLPILIAPHPVLRARTRPVGPADAALVRDLVPRMFSAMYRAPGIGLAAPQVGQSLRVITIDLMPDEKPAPLTLINPEILALSEERATREEGCLSLPGQYADVTRPARVKVRYLDQTGARREIEADGLLAACLQHEIDHLDGVLFVDHLSALKRNIIMRRLAKEQRQKNEGK
jgi:peptide deformylase